MDFSDLHRGGTAPVFGKSHKGRESSGLGTTRPKTRAIDSDLCDTNLDLKTQRPLRNSAAAAAAHLTPAGYDAEDGSSTSFERETALLQPTPPSAATQPRAPSRSRVSKDPRRPQQGQALLSGLSAYSQNIPSMILHPSKKKARAASPRAPVVKEQKTLHQMNELRNAYGADFPLGKSLPRPKAASNKSSGSCSPSAAAAAAVNPLNAVSQHAVTAAAVATAAVVSALPTPAESASANIRSSRKSSRTSSASSTSSAARESVSLHGTGTAHTTGMAMAMGLSLQTVSIDTLESRTSGANSSAPCSPLAQQTTSPRKSKRPTTGAAATNALLKVSLANSAAVCEHANQNDANDDRTVEREAAPRQSAQNKSFFPPSDTEENKEYNNNEEESKEKQKQQKQRKEGKDHSTNRAQGERTKEREGEGKEAEESMHVSDASLPHAYQSDFEDDDYFSQAHAHSTEAHAQTHTLATVCERGDDEARERETATTATYSGAFESTTESTVSAPDREKETGKERTDREREREKEKKERERERKKDVVFSLQYDSDKDREYYNDDGSVEQPRDRERQGMSTQESQNNDDNNNDNENDALSTASSSAGARPQSRKLYLGSEQTQRRAKDSSSLLKAPRSAGARFAATSAISPSLSPTPSHGEAFNKPHLKRQSSHNDVPQNKRLWPEDERQLTTNRPPSRQSSAFPVHLAGSGSNRDRQRDRESESSLLLTSPSVHPVSVNKRIANAHGTLEDTVHLVDRVSVSPVPPHVLPNTEPRVVKKTKSASSSVAVSASEMDDLSLSQRPPSRQKVAAQHLFDEGKGAEAKTSCAISGRRSSARILLESDSVEFESLSPSRSMKKLSGNSNAHSPFAPQTAMGGPRTASGRGSTSSAATNRAAMAYDPRDDGFLEIDPGEEHVPFSININYGDREYDSLAKSQSSTSTVRKASRSNNAADEQMMMTEQFSDLSLGVNNSVGAFDAIKTSTRRNNNTNNFATVEHSPYNALSSRPKTTSPLLASGASRLNGVKSSYYMEGSPEDTLRSKSAHSYGAMSTREHALPTLDSEIDRVALPPAKQHRSNVRAPKNAVNSAWGNVDPRSIPRAQNTFGLEADSGWTSPAMLAMQGPEPDLFDNILDDDDLTIMTEDSGHNIDHSMSMQSFVIESSLGEDFLSLFAPAGR